MAAMREWSTRPGRTGEDGRARPLVLALVVVALVLVAGAVVVDREGLDEPWFDLGGSAGGPSSEPESGGPATAGSDPTEAAAPDVPEPGAPPVVAEPQTAAEQGRMRPRAVARILGPRLDDPDLGRHVVGLVVDLASGEVAYERGGAARPASLTKLLTAAAVLHVLGAEHRFDTRTVLQGSPDGGRRTVVLVGGGDPYLASQPGAGESTYPERADLRTLARLTADALAQQSVSRVRVGYDDSLFTGPDASPHWEADYLPDGVVAPIRALWVDEGRPQAGFGRVEDPSRTAALRFATELRRAGRPAGLRVDGPPVVRRGGDEAVALAAVQSAPLAQIVERMLTVSDNEAAEVLAHQVGVATVGRGSFAGGVAGVRQALTELGIPLEGALFYDGSGLSRDNRLRPATLAAVLRVAASDEQPGLRAVLTGLPVAGFTGSLEYRFADTPAASWGRVRAKTGTLRGTSSLAGLATDLDGTTVAFVLAADRVRLPDTLDARDALDAAAAALAACHCSR